MSMTQVTKGNLSAMLKRYEAARANDDSEAMFVLIAKYRGVFLLSTSVGATWIGMQNPGVKWADSGKPFASVRAALESALLDTSHPMSSQQAVYYSDDSAYRLRWLADRISRAKTTGDIFAGA